MLAMSNLRSIWESVMDEEKNPLQNYHLQTAHMIMQVLAWMWSAIFSVAIGSYLVFGVSAVGHLLVIGGVFITIAVFRTAEANETMN